MFGNKTQATIMQSNNFKYNDGGLSKSLHSKDKNSCAVQAMAIAFNLDYDHAYLYLQAHGRRHGQGTYLPTSEAVIEIGCKLTNSTFKKFDLPHPTICKIRVRDFCATYNKGTYIVRIKQHIFTVIDGVQQDVGDNAKDIVISAFKIIPHGRAIEPLKILNQPKKLEDYEFDF